MKGKDIGDLLNDQTAWGWFQGGFTPTGTVNGCTTDQNVGGNSVVDYSPHHNAFAYYESTSNRSENLSDSLSLFLLHRPVPAVARWSYLVSTGVLRLLKGELPGDVDE